MILLASTIILLETDSDAESEPEQMENNVTIMKPHQFLKDTTVKEDILERGGKIIDVSKTSTDTNWRQLNYSWPHSFIPFPYNRKDRANYGLSVKGIWESLKVFENEGVDIVLCTQATMTKRIPNETRGSFLGWQAGIFGTRILQSEEAAKKILFPTYRFMLEHNCQSQIMELQNMYQSGQPILLIDTATNEEIAEKSEVSSAWLLKMYLEGKYPPT